MSLLSDKDIRGAFINRRISIDPFIVTHVQPSSYDVRLDKHFKLFDNSTRTAIDSKVKQPMISVEVPEGHPFVLHPGEFVLGSTIECVRIGEYHAGRLEGKSSLGRLGLLTHATAGFIDPGFTGNITLELANVANLPIMLWPGMKIGQLCFFDLSSSPAALYGQAHNHYQGQRGPTESRAFMQFEEPKPLEVPRREF